MFDNIVKITVLQKKKNSLEKNKELKKKFIQ